MYLVICDAGQCKGLWLGYERIHQRLGPKIYFGHRVVRMTPGPLNHHLANITPCYAKFSVFVCMKHDVKISLQQTPGALTAR